MTPSVTAGVDGSAESRAAAGWAAEEALARGVPLRIVCAESPRPGGGGGRPPSLEAERFSASGDTVREVQSNLAALYPELEITGGVVDDTPAQALLGATDTSQLLVIGSRGLGAVAGFFVGSVGLSVIAHATLPVVSVRGGDQGGTEGPIVAGLDLKHVQDEVLSFAFETAGHRGKTLRVANAWSAQQLYAYPSALPDPRVLAEAEELNREELRRVLAPWCKRYPQVELEIQRAESAIAPYLLELSADASLVVVGRRTRGHPFPTRIGPVTHAVLHHAECPVAVVPHA